MDRKQLVAELDGFLRFLLYHIDLDRNWVNKLHAEMSSKVAELDREHLDNLKQVIVGFADGSTQLRMARLRSQSEE